MAQDGTRSRTRSRSRSRTPSRARSRTQSGSLIKAQGGTRSRTRSGTRSRTPSRPRSRTQNRSPSKTRDSALSTPRSRSGARAVSRSQSRSCSRSRSRSRGTNRSRTGSIPQMSRGSTQNLSSKNQPDAKSALSEGNSNLPAQPHFDVNKQSSEGIEQGQAKAASFAMDDGNLPSKAFPGHHPKDGGKEIPKFRSPSPRVQDRDNSGQHSRSPSPISRDDDSYQQGRSPSPKVRDREGTLRRSRTATPPSGDRAEKVADPMDVNETRQTVLLKEPRPESARDENISTLTSILNANATQDVAHPSAELSGQLSVNKPTKLKSAPAGTGEGPEAETTSLKLPETQEIFDGTSDLRLLKEPVADANIDVAPLEAEAQQYVKGLLMDVSKEQPVLDLNSASEYVKRLRQLEDSVHQKQAALKETENTNGSLMKQIAELTNQCQQLKQSVEEKDAQLDLEREERKAVEHRLSEVEAQGKTGPSDDALLERERNLVEKEKKLIDMHSQLLTKEQALESKYFEVDQARKIMQEQHNERDSKFEERLRLF